MRHMIGDSHGISVQLAYARREAWRHLVETDRVRALRAVRDEVLPLAGKLRLADPESFETHRDALAVLLNECALAVVDEQARPPVTGFDAVRVRRTDPLDVVKDPCCGRRSRRTSTTAADLRVRDRN